MDNHLLPLYNKLHDIINKIKITASRNELNESNELSSDDDIMNLNDIKFPKIVVVGSQSAGKSSVLESLVKRDFLPRSNGICTRRPLELRLHNNYSDKINNDEENDGDDESEENEDKVSNKKNGDIKLINQSSNGEEYAIFGHLPNQKFTNFDLVKEEILKQTTDVAGSDRGISSVPIILEIFSPNVVPLSLVDLPGVTKVPVGNQPHDIEKLTEDLTLKYIKDDDTIILAVSAANVDIANSDAIKLAKRVDPKGNRTIGVLTKLDLMDKGTNAKNILTGKGDIVLRHGFIGVVCRSQADSNLSIIESIEKENEFLTSHYRSIAKVNGCLYLGKRLSELLIGSIKRELPNIKEKIRKKLILANEKIKLLGEPVGNERGMKSRLLLSLLKSYSEVFSSSIDGNNSSANDDDIYLKEVCGGARINHCLNESFEKQISKLSPLEGLSDETIRTVIAGSNGLQTSLSVPERAFRKLVHVQIKQLKSPCLQLVDMIVDELQRIAVQSETAELKRFSNLHDKISDVVRSLFDTKAEETRQMVTNLINIELSHINTRHPSFSKEVLFHPLETRKRSNSNINRTTSSESIYEKNIRSRGHNGHPSPALNSMSNKPYASEPSFPNIRMDDNDTFDDNDELGTSSASSKSNTNGAGVGSFFFNIYQSTKSDTNKSLSKTPLQLPPISFTIKHSETNGNDDDPDRPVAIVKSLLESYMNIVQTTLMDMIPKTIICFLVNSCKDELHHTLMSSLYKDDLIEALLNEDEDISTERQNLYKIQQVLNEAAILLGDIKELRTSA